MLFSAKFISALWLHYPTCCIAMCPFFVVAVETQSQITNRIFNHARPISPQCPRGIYRFAIQVSLWTLELHSCHPGKAHRNIAHFLAHRSSTNQIRRAVFSPLPSRSLWYLHIICTARQRSAKLCGRCPFPFSAQSLSLAFSLCRLALAKVKASLITTRRRGEGAAGGSTGCTWHS